MAALRGYGWPMDTILDDDVYDWARSRATEYIWHDQRYMGRSSMSMMNKYSNDERKQEGTPSGPA
jgi:hypothetical protein